MMTCVQMPPLAAAPGELRWLRGRVAEREARNEILAAQLAKQAGELQRRLGKDSSTSSRPPSSDDPYKKRPRDRSLRARSGRRPGKQLGRSSLTARRATSSPKTSSPTSAGSAADGRAAAMTDTTGSHALGSR